MIFFYLRCSAVCPARIILLSGCVASWHVTFVQQHKKNIYSFWFTFQFQRRHTVRSLFPRVFFTQTKYRWNRNKCWTELACYTPNARPTTKNIKIKGTKNMGEKKNFCSILFCSAKSLLFFSTFDHLSSHFWCSCFFTGSSKFGGMVRSYLLQEITKFFSFMSFYHLPKRIMIHSHALSIRYD